MQRRPDGSMPVDEMMDGIEADQSDENEIDGDDVVEQPRHDQDQYTGNDGDERRDMSSGNDHGFSSGVGQDWMGLKVPVALIGRMGHSSERETVALILADLRKCGTCCVVMAGLVPAIPIIDTRPC
jgi:hypothetical protein